MLTRSATYPGPGYCPRRASRILAGLSAAALLTLAPAASAATGSGYLPFRAGTTIHVYQANGSDPGCSTHCSQPDYYAWDFGAPSGSAAGMQIVSATSGTVIGTRSSYQGTCTSFMSACAFGNYVFVHNDDGTYCEYLHMMHGSVAVAVGQHVTPGAAVGQVGSTGYTGGFAHLHYSWLASARGTGDSPSVGNSSPGSFIGIGHPTTGQNMVSNNAPRPASGSTFLMSSTGGGFVAPQQWSKLLFAGSSATLASDVNGDGKTDLVAINDASTWVMLSTASGFTAPQPWSNTAFYGSKTTVAGDVNGDGKTDLVAINDASTWVMLSTGSGFTAPQPWSNTAFYGSKTTVAGDVNGDGKTDLVAINDASTWVMLSTASGFTAPQPWSNTAFYGSKTTVAGDVNGDGKTDLVAINDASTWVMLSTASGFTAPQPWSNTAFYGSKTTVAGDVNGDGKTDLVAINDASTWVMLSTASGFTAPQPWSSTAFYGTLTTVTGDANGDGKTDLLAINYDPGT